MVLCYVGTNDARLPASTSWGRAIGGNDIQKSTIFHLPENPDVRSVYWGDSLAIHQNSSLVLITEFGGTPKAMLNASTSYLGFLENVMSCITGTLLTPGLSSATPKNIGGKKGPKGWKHPSISGPVASRVRTKSSTLPGEGP